MSCLGSTGVVGLGIVPRRVAARLPPDPGIFRAWTEALDAGWGANVAEGNGVPRTRTFSNIFPRELLNPKLTPFVILKL